MVYMDQPILEPCLQGDLTTDQQMSVKIAYTIVLSEL